MLDYAEKLALRPADIGGADLGPLYDAGLSERDVHDLVQVVAYFSYINRVAEGLGTELEPDMPPKPDGWRHGKP